MDIQKFNDNDFGSLTTIKNPKTGKIMFVGQEVAKQWGHTNLTQAIKAAKFTKEDSLVIHFKQFVDFKSQLTNAGLVSGRSKSITLITEGGLYKLAMASNLEKGNEFRNWMVNIVLPSIRETGSYSLTQVSVKQLQLQTMRSVQLQNSKNVNSKNYEEKGIAGTIEYNKENCKQVTGLEPNQIRKIAGKKSGSAKEILRKTNPELAATMSLNDFLVVDNGARLEELKKLDTIATELFKEFNKLGFQITE